MNVGSGFREASASGPGSQTAVAVSGDTAEAQQAALNSLTTGRKLKARGLKQTGKPFPDQVKLYLNIWHKYSYLQLPLLVQRKAM